MRERRRERGEDDEECKQKRVRFLNDQQVESGDDEEDADSDEFVYDSEEEAEEEKQYQQRQEEKAAAEAAREQMIKTAGMEETPIGYDIEAEVKKVKKYKAAAGVKFVEYDELGIPKNDGFDHYKYISTDTSIPDTVLNATPDQMERALHPTGERFDYDKQRDEMNEEGKQLFND